MKRQKANREGYSVTSGEGDMERRSKAEQSRRNRPEVYMQYKRTGWDICVFLNKQKIEK